jgi:hypothetical protein
MLGKNLMFLQTLVAAACPWSFDMDWLPVYPAMGMPLSIPTTRLRLTVESASKHH